MATVTNPSVDELEKREEELFRTGPLSVLTTSVKSNSQVLVEAKPGSFRNGHENSLFVARRY